MEDIKQSLLEKSFSFYCRSALRVMSWVTLMFYMIFRIIIPVVNKERLTLDVNDGYVMMGCIGLLLAVEAVKMAYENWINKKLK